MDNSLLAVRDINHIYIVVGEMVGEARGEARAEDRLNTLNLKLLAEKRYNDLERSAQDKDYQKKLCREFGL